MNRIVYLLVFWSIHVGFSHAGDWCYFDNFRYCDYGCCTNDCCDDDCCEDELWQVWAIIGAVIGGILLVSFVACIACVLIKHKGRPGRVIQPELSMAPPPAYTTAVAYTTVPYSQQSYADPPPLYPPPVFQPSSQNRPRNPASAIPEGLQSEPPASGGLPGNHKVV